VPLTSPILEARQTPLPRRCQSESFAEVVPFFAGIYAYPLTFDGIGDRRGRNCPMLQGFVGRYRDEEKFTLKDESI
jgi:hypothetical protein